MLRAKALVTLVSSSLVLAACGQLIGLGDYEEVEGNASGSGGKGGGAGKGGSSSGKGGSAGSSSGAAGETGEGGAAAVGGGTTGGTSGDSGTAGSGESGSPGVGGTIGGSAGEGGTSAGSDSGGSGGTDGGTGGTDGGSGGQGGGPVRNCTEIAPGTVVVAYDRHEAPSFVSYYTEIDSPLAFADLDYVKMEFYDGGGFNGGSVGTFDLGTAEEAQYQTCARCLFVHQNDTQGNLKLFFQESGALIVQSSSDQMNGTIDVQLQDVTLIEVTVEDATALSTPVENGDCVHIEQATLTWTMSEPTWSCYPSWQGDAYCDCGCLVQDEDCSAPTSDVCPAEQGCWCPDEDACNAESNWLCDEPTP
jgi:hypothetical protein